MEEEGLLRVVLCVNRSNMNRVGVAASAVQWGSGGDSISSTPSTARHIHSRLIEPFIKPVFLHRLRTPPPCWSSGTVINHRMREWRRRTRAAHPLGNGHVNWRQHEIKSDLKLPNEENERAWEVVNSEKWGLIYHRGDSGFFHLLPGLRRN